MPPNLSLDLEGMELLTIQYMLDGKNTEYGYKFKLVGLDKASFSGSRDEDMLDTSLVQTAEEAGDLRKVKFYIQHVESPEKSRAVKLNFYEDGHITSGSEITPEEFDKIVEAIAATKSYSKYLNSLDTLIDEYILEINLEGEREKYRNRVSRAFKKLSSNNLNVSTDHVVDSYIHSMVLANIGIGLYKKSISKSDLDYDPSMVPTDWDQHISRFFEDYVQYQMEGVPEEAHNFVASKLNSLLETVDPSEEDYDAITLLEEAQRQYDL